MLILKENLSSFYLTFILFSFLISKQWPKEASQGLPYLVILSFRCPTFLLLFPLHTTASDSTLLSIVISLCVCMWEREEEGERGREREGGKERGDVCMCFHKQCQFILKYKH